MEVAQDNKKCVKKYFIIISFTVVFIILLNCLYFFVYAPTKIDGDSMEPTLNDGAVVIVHKIYDSIDRGDIIVFYYNGIKVVKRVIGIANDIVRINDSKLYLNGGLKYELDKNAYNDKTYYIGEEEFFVVGDNINHSYDSRNFGKITKKDIIGKIKV